MTQKQHIVVADDDPQIRKMLRLYLTGEGFDVTEVSDGKSLRIAFDKALPDLVLLDLVMPGEDGISLARYIRQRSQVPIIMLTGKGDVIDRVAGLEAGADDYVGKPFHLRELLARIRTVLRRVHPAGGPAVASTPPLAGADPNILCFAGLRLDTVKRELRRAGGDAIALTTGEYEMLCAFARSANRVLSRDQIMDLAKGRDWAANDRAIDAQIVRLRRKIETNPKEPDLIKTVRGAGYILAASVTNGEAV